jgi:hypothetical protein
MSGKVEEYAKKLKQHEQEKAEKAAKFDIKALIQSSKQIRSVEVEGLGVVEYGVLTQSDVFELAKYKTTEEKSIATIWLMLRKANPELTFEDIKNLPIDVTAKIMAALTEDMNFLTGAGTK